MTESALEQERDFLLASLDDLEAEYAAGDLDDVDYHALKGDYTTRAARVLRAIDTGGVPAPAAEETTRSRAWMWLVGVGLVAALAGVLVAQFSGSRGVNETISGDIRVTTRELLLDAQQRLGDGDIEAAIGIYDEVLEIAPANTEALAYKGWFLRLQGEVDQARPLVEDAVAIEPDYPDALVFATAIALDQGDVNAAVDHLAAFDRIVAPPFMEQLVVEQGMRDRLGFMALEMVGPLAIVDDPVPFDQTDLTVATVEQAAELLARQGDVFTGVETLEWVLESVPGDPDALAAQGWLIARSFTPEDLTPAEVGLAYLDRAIAAEPTHVDALVYRTFVRNLLGDTEGAAADLRAYDELGVDAADLDELIAEFGLRETLIES